MFVDRFVITTVDKESGINSTRYKIVEKRAGIEIEIVKPIVAPPTRRDAPARKRVLVHVNCF